MEAGVDAITTGLNQLVSIAGSLINFMMDNPILSLCFIAGTIVPAGFVFFREAKHAAK